MGSRVETWAAAWVVGLTGFAMIVRFPLERQNIDKPTLLAHIALALPAGWVLADVLAHGRAAAARRVRWLLVAIIVPMNLLVPAAYLLERDPRTYRPHEKEAFAFIDRTAPADCIVFDSQDRDRPGVEIARRIYWSHEQFMSTHEYPKREVDARRAVRDDLYSEDGPGEASIARLKAFGAPVRVIVRAGAAVPGGATRRGGGRWQDRSRTAIAIRWRGHRRSSGSSTGTTSGSTHCVEAPREWASARLYRGVRPGARSRPARRRRFPEDAPDTSGGVAPRPRS
jgi:hypothetical protein